MPGNSIDLVMIYSSGVGHESTYRCSFELLKPRNFIALDGKNLFDAIRKKTRVKYVFSRGTLLVRTIPEKNKT